jgi:hypothetical protein
MTRRWRVNKQAAQLALGTASALGLARFAYGLLLPAMRDDLHRTLAEAGGVGTANGLGHLVGALATVGIVRRWGTRISFRAAMVLTAVSLATTASSDAYSAVLAARSLRHGRGSGTALVRRRRGYRLRGSATDVLRPARHRPSPRLTAAAAPADGRPRPYSAPELRLRHGAGTGNLPSPRSTNDYEANPPGLHTRWQVVTT